MSIFLSEMIFRQYIKNYFLDSCRELYETILFLHLIQIPFVIDKSLSKYRYVIKLVHTCVHIYNADVILNTLFLMWYSRLIIIS